MVELAKSEIIDAKATLVTLEESLVKALTPADDADDRSVVLEVRAGTGTRCLLFIAIEVV